MGTVFLRGQRNATLDIWAAPEKPRRTGSWHCPKCNCHNAAKILECLVCGARRRAKESPEDLFAFQLRAHQFPTFERQVLFAKAALGRRWAFDFAFREYMLAVEIDGVCVRRVQGELIVSGRHASIAGIRGDNEKLNCAALLGWSVLRFLQTDVKPEHALRMTMRVLAARGWRGP